MSDENDTTASTPHTRIHIQFTDGDSIVVDCPPTFFGLYISYSQSAFLEAISHSENWFSVEDIQGEFHAVPIGQIKRIRVEFVEK